MKRFKLGYSGKLYSSEIYCDNELMITADVVDLLNELATKCSYLKKENEQLKKTISMYSDATKSDMREIKELMQDIEELQKENEQLKSENQKLMKALGESGRMAVNILLPKDEDTLTLNGKWW